MILPTLEYKLCEDRLSCVFYSLWYSKWEKKVCLEKYSMYIPALEKWGHYEVGWEWRSGFIFIIFNVLFLIIKDPTMVRIYSYNILMVGTRVLVVFFPWHFWMFKIFYNVQTVYWERRRGHIRAVVMNGWSMGGGEGEMAEGEKRKTLARYTIVMVALSVTILWRDS